MRPLRRKSPSAWLLGLASVLLLVRLFGVTGLSKYVVAGAYAASLLVGVVEEVVKRRKMRRRASVE